MLIDYAHILLVSVLVIPLLSAMILWMLPHRFTFVGGIMLSIIWMIATCVLLPELWGQRLTLSWSLSSETGELFNIVRVRAGIDQTGLLLTSSLVVGLGVLLSQKAADRILMFLLGFCSQVVAVSDDIGSWMSALVAGALCLATMTSEGRDSSHRERARSLLTRQTAGAVLLFSGWAMLMAVVSQVKAAPFGTPGISTSGIAGLSEMLVRSLARHPAAGEVWAQFELLPVLIIGLGFWILIPIFPFDSDNHVRVSESPMSQLSSLLWSRTLLFSVFHKFLLPCQSSQFFSYVVLAIYVALSFTSVMTLFVRESGSFTNKLISWASHAMCLMFLGSPFTLSSASLQMAFVCQTIGLAFLVIVQNVKVSLMTAIGIIVVPVSVGLLGATAPEWGGGSLTVLFMTGLVSVSWIRRATSSPDPSWAST